MQVWNKKLDEARGQKVKTRKVRKIETTQAVALKRHENANKVLAAGMVFSNDVNF